MRIQAHTHIRAYTLQMSQKHTNMYTQNNLKDLRCYRMCSLITECVLLFVSYKHVYIEQPQRRTACGRGRTAVRKKRKKKGIRTHCMGSRKDCRVQIKQRKKRKKEKRKKKKTHCMGSRKDCLARRLPSKTARNVPVSGLA